MKRIYLDNAATTPMDPRVKDSMDAYFEYEYGNPSAIYQEGLIAKRAIDTSRTTIARLLNVHNDEIFFTGSGTESDNLAIAGVVKAFVDKKLNIVPHVITSVIEHPAVLQTVKEMERTGLIEASYVNVNNKGLINPTDVQKLLKDETILISIMQANSEIGTIQPVREIVKIIRNFRKNNGINKDTVGYPYVHTDACQSFNYIKPDMQKLGVDLYTFNGSKIYGPKGVGVLFIKRGVTLTPIIHGGQQESGVRAGTENVAGIVGIAVATKLVEEVREVESVRLTKLRDYFIKELLSKIPNSELNGDEKRRLPNNVNISIPNIEQDMVVIELDTRGIACSSKSACKSLNSDESHVIKALGKIGESLNTIRFTLGRETTKNDLDETMRALIAFLDKMNKLKIN